MPVNKSEIQEEFYDIRVNKTDTLFLKRIYQNKDGPVLFFLHGSIENGRIFYSNSGKGLAPFLLLTVFVFVLSPLGCFVQVLVVKIVRLVFCYVPW